MPFWSKLATIFEREEDRRPAITSEFCYSPWSTVLFKRIFETETAEDDVYHANLYLVPEKAGDIISYLSMRILELMSPVKIMLFKCQEGVWINIQPNKQDSLQSLCVTTLNLKILYGTKKCSTKELAVQLEIDEEGQPKKLLLKDDLDELIANFGDLYFWAAGYLTCSLAMDSDSASSILNKEIANEMTREEVRISSYDEVLFLINRQLLQENCIRLARSARRLPDGQLLHMTYTTGVVIQTIMRFVKYNDRVTASNISLALATLPHAVHYDFAVFRAYLYDLIMSADESVFTTEDLAAMLQYPKMFHYREIKKKAIKIVKKKSESEIRNSKELLELLETREDIALDLINGFPAEHPSSARYPGTPDSDVVRPSVIYN